MNVEDRKKIIQYSIKEELEKSLYKLDEKINSVEYALLSQYESIIINILDSIIEAQKKEVLSHLSLILIVLSRTAIANKQFMYSVFAFNEKADIKNPVVLPDIDCSFFYQYLEEITKASYISCKKYVRQGIILPDIEQELYQYLNCFNMYFVTFMRKVFQTETVKNKLECLIMADSFMVLQNEMSKKPYCIYEKP